MKTNSIQLLNLTQHLSSLGPRCPQIAALRLCVAEEPTWQLLAKEWHWHSPKLEKKAPVRPLSNADELFSKLGSFMKNRKRPTISTFIEEAVECDC